MSHRTSGLVFAVLSALLFSTSGILAKPLLESGWSSGAAVLVRIGGAALVMLVPTLILISRSPRVVGTNWRYLLAYGLFPIAGAQLAQNPARTVIVRIRAFGNCRGRTAPSLDMTGRAKSD